MSDEIMINPNGESDIVKAMQIAAANINGLSQQMGLVNSRIDDLEQRYSDHERRITIREQREILNSAQCRQMRKTVIQRVNEVLKIKFKGGKVADESVKTDVLYRGGFIARLYADAKSHSKMGESYRDTLAVDYDEVMTYIQSWYPEVEGGAEAYKRYLDIRREEREKRTA